MKTYQVEYEASGGHLHAWRSGIGRFTMQMPDDATDEDVQRTAESLALKRAKRRIEHNAGLGTVTVTEAIHQ